MTAKKPALLWLKKAVLRLMSWPRIQRVWRDGLGLIIQSHDLVFLVIELLLLILQLLHQLVVLFLLALVPVLIQGSFGEFALKA